MILIFYEFPRDRMAATGDVETGYKTFLARQPMGRLGTPEEIAAAAAFLASDEVGGQNRICDSATYFYTTTFYLKFI